MSRRSILSQEDYLGVVINGVNRGEFNRFVIDEWGFFSVLAFFLGIKRVKKEYPSYKKTELTHSLLDTTNKIFAIQDSCGKSDLIKVSEHRIRLEYEGEGFVNAFPFYNKVLSDYNPLVNFLLGGGLGGVIGFVVWALK